MLAAADDYRGPLRALAHCGPQSRDALGRRHTSFMRGGLCRSPHRRRDCQLRAAPATTACSSSDRGMTRAAADPGRLRRSGARRLRRARGGARRGRALATIADPEGKLRIVGYFDRLARTLGVLEDRALGALLGQPIPPAAKHWLELVVELRPYGGTGGPPSFTGWWFDLFRLRQ